MLQWGIHYRRFAPEVTARQLAAVVPEVEP